MSEEKAAVPCVKCQTTGGYRPDRCKKPIRRNGKRFGLPGWLCTACYEYLKRRAAGRRVHKKLGPLTEEQRELAGAYWPVAAKVAGEFGRAHPYSAVDFSGAATIGLIRAAKVWTPDKPYAFATCARLYAIRGCQSEIKALRDKNSSVSTVSLAGCDHHEEILSREEPSLAAVEKADTLDWLLTPLPQRQRRLVRLIFVGGLTTEEAGKVLGIKKDRSNQLRRQALDTLRYNPRILEVAS